MEIDWTRMCYNLVTLYTGLHFVHYISTYRHQYMYTGGLQIQNSLYRCTASLTYIFNIVNYIGIPCGLIKHTEQS